MYILDKPAFGSERVRGKIAEGTISELFLCLEHWCIDNNYGFDINNIHYNEKLNRLIICVSNNDKENRIDVKEFAILKIKQHG